MADIRIKDFPAGPFESGERMGSDSIANGTRSFDISAVIQGVLGEVHNQNIGTFTAGEKMLTDSLVNGPRRVDVQDVIDGVLSGLASQPVGSFVAGNEMLVNAAGVGQQIDAQDVIDGVLEAIDALPAGTFTAGEKIATDSVANGARNIDVQDIIDAYDAAIAAAVAGVLETADNGLTENVPGNVQLGGNLLQNTIIGALAAGFDLDLIAADLSLVADGLSGLLLSATVADVDIAAPAGEIKLIPSAGAPVVGDHWVATNVDGSASWQTPTARAYGEVGMNPGTPGTGFNVALAGTPVKWTGLTLGSFDGGGLVSYAADQFVVNAGGDGLYRVQLHMGFDGDNDNYFMQLYKNGAPVTDIQTVRTIAGATEGSWGLTGFIDMVATDFLEIWFDAGSNNRTLRVWYSNWNIERIDP